MNSHQFYSDVMPLTEESILISSEASEIRIVHNYYQERLWRNLLNRCYLHFLDCDMLQLNS